MKRPATRIVLSFSGLILLGVGVATLFQPHAFFDANGVTLGSEPSLMSEVRAPGGLLIVSALIMLAGVFRQSMMRLGLILGTLVYGTFGLSRLVSLVLDGVPSSELITAMIIELVVGAVALTALTRSQPNPSMAAPR